jgi:hypothetical protein
MRPAQACAKESLGGGIDDNLAVRPGQIRVTNQVHDFSTARGSEKLGLSSRVQ